MHFAGSADSFDRLQRSFGAQNAPQNDQRWVIRLIRYSFTFRSRNAFVITETELKLIAAAAKIGLSNTPKNG